MTNSHSPTAQDRDLVLSDEDLAEQAATPKTWAPNEVPQAERLSAWLKVCTDAERLNAASRWIAAANDSHRCFLEDHAGALAEVRRQRSALRQVRAAIEGRTGSVNVSVILSALGEQE